MEGDAEYRTETKLKLYHLSKQQQQQPTTLSPHVATPPALNPIFKPAPETHRRSKTCNPARHSDKVSISANVTRSGVEMSAPK